MTDPILFRGEMTDPKSLPEVVGQAMAAASNCWESLDGTGRYQAAEAAVVLAEALEWINAHYVPKSGSK